MNDGPDSSSFTDRQSPHHRVYLRWPGLVVAGRHISVGDTRYRVDQLTDITCSRGPRHRGIVTGLVGAAIGAVVAALALRAGEFAVGGMGLALVVVGLCVAAYCNWRWPADYQLSAYYHGREVCLFQSPSQRQFGHVTRALTRARESAHMFD